MQKEESKINIPPAQIVTLASSLALVIIEKYPPCDLFTIRQFLSCLCSSLSLYECQQKIYIPQKDKNK